MGRQKGSKNKKTIEREGSIQKTPVTQERKTDSPSPYTTTSYETMKKLHAAGILARNTYGQPMVFEYAPEDRGRIDAVLVEKENNA